MTARLAADSTDPAKLPDWVSIKCFYINGRYKATPEQIKEWPGPKILINVTGDPADGGDLLDIEPGNAGPAAAPGWYDARKAAGVARPGIYSDRIQFDAITRELAGRPAARVLATLDGTLHRAWNGVQLDACQNLGSAMTGGDYDLWVVFNHLWHPDPPTGLAQEDIKHLKALCGGTIIALNALNTAITQL